jgi:hypothetical protein
MIIHQEVKSGFKKTLIKTDVDEILKEYVRILKKKFCTSASFQKLSDEKIIIELNGHPKINDTLKI